MKFISRIVDFDSTILFVEYANINICIPQSPFWFLTRPVVENLLDDEGRILSNKVRQKTNTQCVLMFVVLKMHSVRRKVRVKWGALHNFKCVDYFQVEYHQVGAFWHSRPLLPFF